MITLYVGIQIALSRLLLHNTGTFIIIEQKLKLYSFYESSLTVQFKSARLGVDFVFPSSHE